MSGFGLACNNEGNIYCSTGNGRFDGEPGDMDKRHIPKTLCDSVIKLDSNLKVLDFFTPYNQQDLEGNHLDIATGGVMLLPKQNGVDTIHTL